LFSPVLSAAIDSHEVIDRMIAILQDAARN
jgi:hypothetical protein